MPLLNWLFRTMQAIPVASAREDAALKEAAFETAAKALRAGEDPAVEETASLFRTGRVADVSAMTAAWVCASVRGEQPVVAYAPTR